MPSDYLEEIRAGDIPPDANTRIDELNEHLGNLDHRAWYQIEAEYPEEDITEVQIYVENPYDEAIDPEEAIPNGFYTSVGADIPVTYTTNRMTGTAAIRFTVWSSPPEELYPEIFEEIHP